MTYYMRWFSNIEPLRVVVTMSPSNCRRDIFTDSQRSGRDYPDGAARWPEGGGTSPTDYRPSTPLRMCFNGLAYTPDSGHPHAVNLVNGADRYDYDLGIATQV